MKKILMALMLCLVSICGFAQQYCPDSVTDAAGNTYSTVQVGSQCWMKENLRYDDTTLLLASSQCLLHLFQSNMHYTGNVCPNGWKVPSAEDYQELLNHGDFTELDSILHLTLRSPRKCYYWNTEQNTITQYLSGSQENSFVFCLENWSGYGYFDNGILNTTYSQHMQALGTNGILLRFEKVRCIKDTGYIESYTPTTPDTIYIHDTITVTDTIYIHDTITVTDTIYIYIDTTNTGIQEWGKTIKAYPNPTTGQLYLEGDFRQVSVWNMNGKCIEVTDEKILNFETLSSGVYILRIITVEGNVVVKKIIKQ